MADLQLGHGMGNNPEVKDWKNICIENVMQLQTLYPQLQGIFSILWHSPRPFSSAILIQVNQQIYFIKRSHCTFRRAFDLQQEHQFIRYLAEQGLSVPIILCTRCGQTAIELDGWSYEVHKQAFGVDIYADHLSWKPFFYPTHAAKTGKVLAKLHQASKNYFCIQNRSADHLVSNQNLLISPNIVAAIQQRIQNRPILSQYFADKTLDQTWLNQLHQVHERIKTTLQHAPKIWTHNDLHASNLLWTEATAQAEISTIIDFGLADQCSAIYDLAVTIERNFIDWLALEQGNDLSIDLRGLDALMQAYMAHTTPPVELSILPDLIKIVHTDFALSELEYFVGITQNLKHADAAYYGWLIAHTQWFHLPQGQAFCQYLAQLIQRYQMDI